MTRPTPSLSQTIDTTHRFLRGSIPLDVAAETLCVPSSRLAVYHRFVRSHIEQTLRKNYAAVCALVGDKTWRDLVDRYFYRYPARDYELNVNAAAFCGFLAELAAESERGISPFIAQLALLEWHEFVVFAAADEAVDPGSGALQMNPTLVILEFDYPVATFLDAFREAQRMGTAPPRVDEVQRPERVLVFRHPETQLACFYSADDDLLFALKLAHEGVSCAVAAKAAQLPVTTVEHLLAQALAVGLLVSSAPSGTT